ncbi:HalOD1 output domain-containing protein [Haloarcula terrestris]|uniref:HalOD1 output domain-containing protein n=1 Tax=Haloarcula terrestris TaxID=2950533 RepID=UPI0038737026
MTAIIIQTVATLEGESMDRLQHTPLHESIDIGAVETLLFGPEGNRSGSETSSVTFRYRSYQITVRGDGLLQVSDTTKISP